MSKLDLRNVTFVCGDSNNNHYEIIKYIIDKVSSQIEFNDIIFERNISSLVDYNIWVSKKLTNIIKTDYCLIFQWDGFPVNV